MSTNDQTPATNHPDDRSSGAPAPAAEQHRPPGALDAAEHRALVADAAAFAVLAHGDQQRKTGGPYSAHLFEAASLLLVDGARAEVVAAALLHDTVEDTAVTIHEVTERFGADVASIVAGCSKHRDEPQQSWRERKEAHLAALRDTGDGRVLWVTAADKLSNVNSLLNHIDANGPDATWSLFGGSRDGSLWYYGAMSERVSARLEHSRLPARLAAAIERLNDRSGA